MNSGARNPEVTRILGAGPAGLIAAITLARAGRAVLVYERAADVGTRHANDFQAIENWTIQEDLLAEFTRWGLSSNFHCVPMHVLTCFGPGFHGTARFEDSSPLFYLVQRGAQEQTLDHNLLAQARAAGAQIEFLRSAQPEQVDIIATGFPRARAFVAGYNFVTTAPNGCYICFDASLTPNLYSYLIMCEGRGTIAFGATAPAPSKLKELLDRIVAGFRSRVRFQFEAPRYFVASGSFGLPQTAQHDGRLYAGEAAQLQDPLFGFGLRLSMATGYLAARSILDGGDYDALWQARLMPQLQAAAVHRMLFQVTGNTGYRLLIPYVRLFGRSGRELCHRHYRPMWYTHLLWPLAKHKLIAELQRQDQSIRQAQLLRRKMDSTARRKT